MTWFQVVEILFHERDEHGIISMGPRVLPTAEDGFRARWREWGLTEEQITFKWAEFLEVEGYKYHLEGKRLPQAEIDKQAAVFERRVVAKRTWGR